VNNKRIYEIPTTNKNNYNYKNTYSYADHFEEITLPGIEPSLFDSRLNNVEPSDSFDETITVEDKTWIFQ